ncbi:transglutaminase family protein [Wenjunlia tyrosinilytica]|uniref:Transglutaminase n=1 Tax=Wenjunlia tyrosinilytica TaxID=1544741 RepID=A0A918DT74_9ACTN|nr:DUF3488 and transglutaminase-like domain-containing protein [Wenjunlia tyrosinilytica]GGO81823.1 transglutaminase [Wenjunlia tyrosinilytica]
MSGRTRLTLCSGLATILVACSLLPLVSPSGWLVQASVLVALQAGVGALGRRVPLARPLAVLAQLVAVLLMLTFVFARHVAPFGIFPGPGALRHLGALVADGMTDVGQYQTPAPVTDGIRLMLVGGVVVIAVLVDALAVTYRNAAPAGLPLLALYSVAAGLSQDGSHWLWFVLAGAGYLLLLLAEGRDRLSRWGRVFAGGGPGRGGSGGLAGGGGESAMAPVRTGRRIGAMALGIALIAPAALPSLGDGLLGAAANGSGRGGTGSGTINASDPVITMQDNLNQPQNREVLKYRTDSDTNSDMYLRTVSLDQFDGASWKSSQRSLRDVPDALPTPKGLDPDVLRQEIHTSVATAGWFRTSWLPMPYPATKVDVRGSWRYEPEARTVVGDHKQTTALVRYQVSSLRVKPTAAQLASAPEPSGALADEYTKVPADLPLVVRSEAEGVTRGAANHYEQAMKLQEWFTTSGGFSYNTRVSSGTGTTAIVRFLRNKEGFCIHYAFTMAAMSRTLGIPSRVAVGFVPGAALSDGSYSVGSKDAHAWPELYFQGVGWVRFEPTPSRGSTPDYAQAQTPSDRATNPTDTPSDTASPSTGPSSQVTCDARAQRAGDCSTQGPLVVDNSSDGGFPTAAVAGIVIGALVLLMLLLPVLWRARVRARRLGGGHVGGAAGARTLAGWQELLDTAWDYGITPDVSETPRRAAARLVRAAGLDTETAEAAHRVASAVEQVMYAPEPRPVPGLADDVRRIESALSAGAGRGGRLRALLLPRSSVRVLWTVSDAWAGLRDRWLEAVRKVPIPARLRQGATGR